jgi:hypothetical protein
VAKRLALDAILVDPDEMQVIGDNDVLRKALIPDDLIGFQNSVEILADGLILDVSENEAALGDLEIGCTLSQHAFRFVVDTDPVCATNVRNRL